MELFRISCTTCKVRLNVRDSNLVGQILPCPKCGSMVLITAPIAGTAQAEPSGAATEPDPSVVNSSFENIESLLDDTPQSHPSTQRWKESEGPATTATESSEGPPSEPVENAAAVPQEEPFDSGPSLDEPDPSPIDATTSSSAINYGLILGGSALGLAMALGVAGFLILRSADRPTEVANETPATTSAPVVTEAESAVVTETESGGATGSETTDESISNIDESGASEIDNSSSFPENSKPDVDQNVAPEVITEPSSDANESHELDTTPTPIPPEGELARTDEMSSGDEEAANNSQIDLADDGLAGFSRWLQSPESFGPNTNTTESSTTTTAAPRRQTAKPIIQPTRPLPTPVDIDQRLNDEIVALEFRQTTLSNALRTLSDYSTIPITITPDALGRRNLSAGKLVSLRVVEPTTVAEVLNKLLAPMRLAYHAEDGQIWVTTIPTSEKKLVEMEHEVGDLCSGDARKTAFFFDWLTGFVAPDSWESRGGQGSGEAQDTKLKIIQDDLVHYQILVLCERLRIARGLPIRSRIKPEFIDLTRKSEQLSEGQRPISLRIWRESNLNAIAAEIERVAGVHVLVDWQALHHAGWSPRDTMRFICQDEPLDSALQSLLAPMGLDYRVVDSSTLQITSAMAYANSHEIEFYRLRDRTTFRQLSQQVMEQVGIDRFQPQGTGIITFDNPSGCLIVSLSPPDHEIVQTILGDAVE